MLAASSGAEALVIFRRSLRPIPLIVTDFNMPQMSGLELTRECALLSSRLSVLYISGRHPGPELEADLAVSRRGFLAKPFLANDLVRKVKELLQESTAPTFRGSAGERWSATRATKSNWQGR